MTPGPVNSPMNQPMNHDFGACRTTEEIHCHSLHGILTCGAGRSMAKWLGQGSCDPSIVSNPTRSIIGGSGGRLERLRQHGIVDLIVIDYDFYYLYYY